MRRWLLFWAIALLLVVPSLTPDVAVAQGGGAYRLTSVVLLPKAPESFDISWVDAAARRYFLADRTNGSVDVVDTDTGTLVGQVGGFVGFSGKTATSGPDGLVAVPDRNELWVGDGDSSVKVIDLTSLTLIASIGTGGTARADELAYDGAHHLIVIANNADVPAYLSFITTGEREVVGKLAFPDATDGIEQPVWDPASGLVYQAVPKTNANPGGEIDVVDPTTRQITAVYPLDDCVPHGLTLGPNHQMLVGCNAGQKLTSVIITTAGETVATIPQIGGSDEVWYNASDNRYFLGANLMTANGSPTGAPAPALGVIDAGTNQWLANIPTTLSAHSVAVDERTKRVFVPLTNVGIGIYTPQGG